MGLVVGLGIGLGYHYSQDNRTEYTATLHVQVLHPDQSEGRHVHVAIQSGIMGTEEAATAAAQKVFVEFENYPNIRVEPADKILIDSSTSKTWWKSATFGGVIGTLVAMAGIYFWEDVRRYQRNRQREGI